MDTIGSTKLNKILDELSVITMKEQKFDPTKHKDETRSKIALIFTYGYFGLILITLVGIPIYNAYFSSNVIEIKDTLLVVSSIVGGPFGFVVGYYFKGSEERQ